MRSSRDVALIGILLHTHGHDRMICLTIVKSFRNVTRIQLMAFFSHTRTHTRTWQMTEWYVWQLWEVSEMLHGYWLMAFSFTHTHGHDKWQNDISDNYEKFQGCFTDTGSWFSFSHTHTHADMTDDRTCLTIVRSFRSVTRILAHGISLSHKHEHDRWQNIYIWQLWEVSEMLHGYWIMACFFTHTHTHGHDWRQNDISDNCEKFQRCYSDTQTLAHGILLPATHTHTHTHGHDWCQNNISDNCEKFQRYYTDTGSWHSFPHTHTHTHRAFINGTHNTIMEKWYQWCCSWCIHTTSPDGWNLASTFPYRKKLFDDACHAVHLSVMRAGSLDFSGFLRTQEILKSEFFLFYIFDRLTLMSALFPPGKTLCSWCFFFTPTSVMRAWSLDFLDFLEHRKS